MDKKLMYKLELMSVKYTPIVTSFIILLSIILSYFDIEVSLLDSMFGTSVLAAIPMYISSYVYKFCKYHRMFIHYIVIVHLVDTCDILFNIPVSDFNLLILYLIITGISSFITLYLYLKYGDRNNNESIK